MVSLTLFSTGCITGFLGAHVGPLTPYEHPCLNCKVVTWLWLSLCVSFLPAPGSRWERLGVNSRSEMTAEICFRSSPQPRDADRAHSEQLKHVSFAQGVLLEMSEGGEITSCRLCEVVNNSLSLCYSWGICMLDWKSPLQLLLVWWQNT